MILSPADSPTKQVKQRSAMNNIGANMNHDTRQIDHTTGLESGVLVFYKSSTITVEAFNDDAELPADEFRAHWQELRGRDVQVTRIERNDARPGKPDYWVKDAASDAEVAAIKGMLSQKLAMEDLVTEWTAADEFDSRRKEA